MEIATDVYDAIVSETPESEVPDYDEQAPVSYATLTPRFSICEVFAPLYAQFYDMSHARTYYALLGRAFQREDHRSCPLFVAIKGYMRPLRVVCFRRFRESTKESIQNALVEAIKMTGLEHHYKVLKDRIEGANGTVIIFMGFTRNPDDIKGLDFDLFIIDEAQWFPHEAARLLVPTMREPGVNAIFIGNPTKRTDWI